MPQALPQSTLSDRMRLVPIDPKVKSDKTCKMSLCGVSGNRGMPKIADPSCYDAHVDQTKEDDMTTRTFNKGDRVRWSAGDQAGDEGTVTRTFIRDGVTYFDVTWDDGEVIDYMDWPGTSCRKIGVAA
jgi:hypothetical protein